MTDEQAKHRIAENIKRLLKLRGMSQAKLAAAADETPMRISYYVNEVNMPGVGVLSRIATALEVTIDELVAPLGGRGKNSA